LTQAGRRRAERSLPPPAPPGSETAPDEAARAPVVTGTTSASGAAGAAWRRHAGLLVVLGLGGVVRLLIDRHAVPGVYQDSLVYLRASPHAPFAPYSPTRPSGYPLVLRMLNLLPGVQLDTVTLVQHLAGLAVGALVYFLVLRSGGRRWLAVAAAAVIVAEAFTVALEQDILAEACFTLAVAGAAYLTLRRSERPWPQLAGGLLLGVACTIRSVGIFAIPVWILWLALTRPGLRVFLGGLAAVAFPVIGYCVVHAWGGAGFSLQGSDGWFLYAKVGPIVDCRGVSVRAGAEPLCVNPPASEHKSFEFYLYDGASPAYQLFHGGKGVYLEDAITSDNNRVLRRFSLAVIAAHPASFVRLVGREFVRYLGPSTAQSELSLYGRPGTVLHWYEHGLHMRWWLFTGALALSVVWLVWDGGPPDLALVVGLAVALVLGAAATSGFNNRYLVPTFPLVAAAGALSVDRLLRALRRRRSPEEARFEGGGSVGQAHLVADAAVHRIDP
jgi:hypothetical protein